jgi:DNA-binding XRE family transcriptional regulator
VEEGLGLDRTLLLLQAATFAQRCADNATALLADPAALVRELLLLLLRNQRFGRVRRAARLLGVWRSEVRRITHREPEYRRIRTKPRRSTAIGCNGGHLETLLEAGIGGIIDGHPLPSASARLLGDLGPNSPMCRLTQAELAKMVGMSSTYVSKVENGRSPPLLDHEIRMLWRLGATITTGIGDANLDSRAHSSLPSDTGRDRASVQALCRTQV